MNKIDSLRKKKCLSYGEIAKESGLTPTYIYLLAKSKRKNPSLEVMKKISRALNLDVEKVFKLN
ncbi:TPA: helix-turn-helix transcriptional regulator [Clostridium botulinum]|uniref:HTH cro/C1-type domain-containing protein n=1 Tax=Clostridium botulinum B str. Osaka05 TaxID=1407017 RepID=A0A0S6U3M6_CLOBO|nr:helix-turn-helix transcriptional regulator [Clostridium botulinum]GAE00951.1 hypothetical protein CBO05C_0641 [Clostridium botulinum B str. Osaka05]HDK7154983.1 helix-turn-helix transcriptional regulator [Clostridium botulinum]